MGLLDRFHAVASLNRNHDNQTTARKLQEAVEPNRSLEELRTPARTDRDNIASIVGIPQSREFSHVGSEGDVRQYEARSGSRINVDSRGQFYDGELRPIEPEAASSYQRMTTEWQSHPHDKTGPLMQHLRQFTQPAIDQYVQEQKLEGLQNASPAQQGELRERLQQKLGLAEDSASLAVIQQVTERKRSAEMQVTPREANELEYRLDTLRGKDGPNYMRELREEKYAESVGASALNDFAKKHNTSVTQLTEEQVEQVGRQVSQQHQIPVAIATHGTSYAHWEAENEANRRSNILEEAVGADKFHQYSWKQQTDNIESYQHNTTGRYIHLDSNARFVAQTCVPIDATTALSHAEQQHIAVPHHDNAIGKAAPPRDQQAVIPQSLPVETASKIEIEAPRLVQSEQALGI
jgi:hypothetical protein